MIVTLGRICTRTLVTGETDVEAKLIFGGQKALCTLVFVYQTVYEGKFHVHFPVLTHLTHSLFFS